MSFSNRQPALSPDEWLELQLELARKKGLNAPLTGLGETILHIAAARGELELVRQLIKDGADPNLTDVLGYTPMQRAASRGQLNVVRYFIEELNMPMGIRTPSGDTLLHLAAASGAVPLIRYLIKKNPSFLMAKNAKGELPVHMAENLFQRDAAHYLQEQMKKRKLKAL